MLDIRTMTPEDIDFGLWLKDQAGWNQTREDWQRFLHLRPEGCFLATEDGQGVGTVTTCVFQDVAWIGMMLVSPTFRGRGIGRALMQHALESLEPDGVTSVRLDATPMGRPLYLKMGFCDQYQVIRYGGPPKRLAHAPAVELFAPADRPPIHQLDRQAIGSNRRALLQRLLDQPPPSATVVRRTDTIAGYCLCRPGSRATQIGPCIARSERSGRALLANALSQLANSPVFVDVPQDNRAAVAVVESAGLEPIRPLARMCRGPDRRERIEWLWASSGPEKG